MPKKLVTNKMKKDYKRLMSQLVRDLSQELVIVQESPMLVDCPNCFESGTLIETPFGLRPIEEFEPGDFILDGNSEPRLVDKVFHRHTLCEFTSLKTHGNNIGISATRNHKLFVYENEGTPYSPVLGTKIEKEIGDISKGDIIYKSIRSLPQVPLEKLWIDWKISSFGPKKILPETVAVTDDFLFALGLYIAEGVTSKGRVVSYCLNDSEIDIGHQVCNYWKDIVDSSYNMYLRGNSKNRVFEIYSSYLADLLDRWCDHGAENKEIPAPLYYRLDKRQTMVLLFGLFVGAGHFEQEYDSIVLGTVSKKLAYQVYNLLLSCGYSASILSQPEKEGKDGILRQESFVVRYWPDENFVQRGTVRDNDAVYQVVKSVDVYEKNTPVWNLEVQTEHSYIANGFSVQNCLWDSINKKSSNVFDNSFTSSATIFSGTSEERVINPIPFSVGRCPVCIGEGQIFTNKEICIPAMVNFFSGTGARRGLFMSTAAGKEGMNLVVVKTLACHYELMHNNETFFIHNNVKCVKFKPPFLRGLGGEETVCETVLQTADEGQRTSGKFGGGDKLSRDDDPRKRIRGPSDIIDQRGKLRGR